ncbi:L,D-transpeptidase family protein [Hymenobacter actinosclerus]|uniref:L,D-TPase catalytic domain-containing protein n=1 Tax=Hymenobacter actinosclerus TaxID=82805 RepID=A0A1I0AMH3_9BACT|nr:hypothetical protein [Hymenobacter actinosclerus]SES95581.1 hypothetical protein SAMN04487998_0776 [Hymenobacter actinosclerus]
MRIFVLLTLGLAAALLARPAARPPAPDPAFRTEQLRYPRVREAYAQYQEAVRARLRRQQIAPERLELFVRAFKMERRVEVWGRNQDGGPFILLRTFALAGVSGRLGPKRRAGDRQIPEGFYTINRFNPNSEFLLSLGLDYPNAADQQHTPSGLDPGDNIFVHGSHETIGCLPITDAGIQELYVLAVEARAAGQRNIPVHIFPFGLTANQLARRQQSPHYAFWQELAPAYAYFETHRTLPTVIVATNGAYVAR